MAIMVGHLFVPVLDKLYVSTFSSGIFSDLLRKELGFEGLAVTDALDMGAIRPLYPPGEREYMALSAGADILLLPENPAVAIDYIKRAVESGKFPEAEIDRRVEKILKAKEKAVIPPLKEELITPYSRALKKRLYEESITAVGDQLPVGKKIKLVQLGISSEETTPLKTALAKCLSDEGETVLALFGMNKFIKENFGLASKTLRYIREAKPACVVVFGSPYNIKLLRDCGVVNVLMAYEDDPDAQVAAARVILGELEPKGRLPISPP